MENRKGSILIIALWTLVLLTTFSIYLGLGVRQRMLMVQRFESRHKLYLAVTSGVRKAIAMINSTYRQAEQPLATLSTKAFLTDNTKDFFGIDLGDATVDIVHESFDKTLNENKKHYGMIDEASKININFADKSSLVRLFRAVFGWDAEAAEKLAAAIIDWRTPGESVLKGFFSQEYYKNLQHPYDPKGRDFEILDEVALVEGMQANLFDRLRDFITIYGDGKININTAPFEVLYALGFAEDIANNIIERRMGRDGLAGTSDDIVFTSTEEFAGAMSSSSAFAEDDALFTQELHGSQKITTSSDLYAIKAIGYTMGQKQHMSVFCVYDAVAHSIIYWQET